MRSINFFILIYLLTYSERAVSKLILLQGKIDSPYQNCADYWIVNEVDYQKNKSKWLELENKCQSKILPAQAVGLTSLNPLNEGAKYLEFALRVAKKVKQNLIKSRTYADCSASCFSGAETCTESKNIILCKDRKNEIAEGLKVYSRKIRMELALSQDAPGMTNVNIRNVLITAKENKDKLINTNLRDFEIATPNPVGRTNLSEREMKEAQRRLTNELAAIEEEFKNKGYKNYGNWMSVKLMERFEYHQAQYRQLIYEEAPVFGVIDTPALFNELNDPVWSDDQLARAFKKLSQNASMTEKKVDWSIQNAKLEFDRANPEALKKWVQSFDGDRVDTNDLLTYFHMKNVVEEVLFEDPLSCGLATSMEARLKSKEVQNNTVQVAASLSTSFLGRAGSAFGFIKSAGAIEVARITGLAVGASYLGDNFRKYNAKTKEAATRSGTGGKEEGVALVKAKDVAAARENLKTALMFSTMDAQTSLVLGKKLYSSFSKVIQKEAPDASTVTSFGKFIETLSPYRFPDSMRLSKYRNKAGEEVLVYEKVVTTKDGKTVIHGREMTVDRLTGAIDANYPAGKSLLEDLVAAHQGKSTLAFIDVNNLGFVNNNFFKGRTAGDEYLAAIAKAVNNALEGRGQIFKLGGDEYGVLIHEVNPDVAKKLLQKIIDECYSKEVHAIFKENSKLRAEHVRKTVFAEDGTRINLSAEQIQSIRDYAPYSKEGVSIGAVTVKNNTSLEELLAAAEAQATRQKIIAKSELNISAKKYGGADAVPGAKPNLFFKPAAELPASISGGKVIPVQSATEKSLTLVKDYGEHRLSKVKYRMGDMSIAEHTMANGESILKYTRYINVSGKREAISREVVVNAKTGFIDGTHESGKYILNKLADGSEASAQKRSLIWINAENLGKINYFNNGMANGDRLLSITAKTIRDEVNASALPVKMQGSEFVILNDGLSKESVTALTQKIHQALVNNPEIKAIYSNQVKFLESEIRKIQKFPRNDENRIKLAELNKNLEDVKQQSPQFSISGHMFKKDDNLVSSLNAARKIRYSQKP